MTATLKPASFSVKLKPNRPDMSGLMANQMYGLLLTESRNSLPRSLISSSSKTNLNSLSLVAVEPFAEAVEVVFIAEAVMDLVEVVAEAVAIVAVPVVVVEAIVAVLAVVVEVVAVMATKQ
jgi:hypothetical protein